MNSSSNPAAVRRAPCALVLVALACRTGGLAPEQTEQPRARDLSTDPSRLCAHSYEILIVPTGAGSPGVRDDFLARCELGAQARRAEMSEADWRARVDCVLAGQTPAALGRCDGREPDAPPKKLDPSEIVPPSVVCDKYIEVELDGFPADMLDPEILEETHELCVKNFEQAYADDPQTTLELVHCMMQTTTHLEMRSCQERHAG